VLDVPGPDLTCTQIDMYRVGGHRNPPRIGSRDDQRHGHLGLSGAPEGNQSPTDAHTHQRRTRPGPSTLVTAYPVPVTPQGVLIAANHACPEPQRRCVLDEVALFIEHDGRMDSRARHAPA
jgi:hypothetical protein